MTTTHSPFALAFLAAERELGARIGYPALVYDAPDELAQIDKLTDALRYLLDIGEWTWSEADKASVFTIRIADSTRQEFTNLLEAI